MAVITRIFDILEHIGNHYPDKKDVFACKQNKEWRLYGMQEVRDLVDNFSKGLLFMGFKKGDKIATISNNRPEWNFVDHAFMQLGLVHVPIYPTISNEEYRHILKHCDARLIFISDKLLFNKIKSVINETANIEDVYTFNEVESAKNWMDIVELGKKQDASFDKKLEERKQTVQPADLATIIYTSGTTGVSKGVMLTHNNLVSNVLSAASLQPMKFPFKVLSFLPLCHVYERMINYQYQYLGVGIYYAENMGTISRDLNDVKPESFTTVPRLLEKLYDKIIEKGNDLSGIKRWIFFWSLNLGHQYKEGLKNGLWYRIKLFIARKLVFYKWKEALGGNIFLVITGGSAVQERLLRIFWAAGIPILEGYGLTEASPCITSCCYEYPNYRFGTVGPAIPGVNVKIAPDGEILAKGPNIMSGYYKNEEATWEVIDEDGWLHTGDIGMMVDDRFLKITDRKKEIFKNSSGKYIAPQPIENRLKESFYIEQAMVIGENEKFASALVSPNFSALHDWCSHHKLHFANNNELIAIPEVIELVQKEVKQCNKTLGATEQINRFRLVPDEWTTDSGELTPSLKLKRKIIFSKYESIVKGIYRYD